MRFMMRFFETRLLFLSSPYWVLMIALFINNPNNYGLFLVITFVVMPLIILLFALLYCGVCENPSPFRGTVSVFRYLYEMKFPPKIAIIETDGEYYAERGYIFKSYFPLSVKYSDYSHPKPDWLWTGKSHNVYTLTSEDKLREMLTVWQVKNMKNLSKQHRNVVGFFKDKS